MSYYSKKIALLIIDPQNDFHEPRTDYPSPSLTVIGSNGDSSRISKIIKEKGKLLYNIVITLDSHQPYHIANPIFWKDKQGKHPNPYTPIPKEEVEQGIWEPSRTEQKLKEHCHKYVSNLEKQGRFKLFIWPEHCIVGTPGHCIVSDIREAAYDWARKYFTTLVIVEKGGHPLTEHYSALKADVELPHESDPCGYTKINPQLLSVAKAADEIWLCGQALSHCVNFTGRDLIAEGLGHKLVLLKDCSSPVTGFETQASDFIKFVTENQGRVMNSTEL